MPDPRRSIASLKNLGPKSSERLIAVGITDADTLRKLGPATAYRRVKTAFPNDTSLNLLWALQGALMETHWQQIPPELKQKLLQQLKTLPPT